MSLGFQIKHPRELGGAEHNEANERLFGFYDALEGSPIFKRRSYAAPINSYLYNRGHKYKFHRQVLMTYNEHLVVSMAIEIVFANNILNHSGINLYIGFMSPVITSQLVSLEMFFKFADEEVKDFILFNLDHFTDGKFNGLYS